MKSKMADLVKFVSKTEIDAKKAQRRGARKAFLQKAKEKYEKQERELEARRQRGEDAWMLPSLSSRLTTVGSEDESSKKKKHKSKKKKKKKKDHKSDSDEDEWIEKNSGTSAALADGGLPNKEAAPLQNEKAEEKVGDVVRSENDTRMKEKPSSSVCELGQHPRELNPYWKEGGAGLPSAKADDKGFSSGNRAWFRRAYERAKQQAEDEGRSLEDVAAERWGSLEKLKSLAYGDGEERNIGKRRSEREEETGREGRRGKNDSSSSRSYLRDDDRVKPEDSRRRGDRHDRGEWDERAFRKPAEEQRVALKKLLKPPEEETSASTSWNKQYESYRNRVESNAKTSGGWRKRPEPQSTEKEDARSSKQDVISARTERESSDSESSSDDSQQGEEDGEDTTEKELMSRKVTDAELNALGAKRLKAELIGNEELTKELDAKLDKLRKLKERQEKSGCGDKSKEDNDNVVILTRTDRAGNVVPVEHRARTKGRGKGRKRHKNVTTHDDEGKRRRYFCDDDDHDLTSLVKREKMSTAEDQNATYARLAHKLGGQFDLDDKFESAAASKYTTEELEEKARQKAIREHHRLAAQMENCKYCLDSPELAKHLIIAIGLKAYLALPSNQSLCDGHCLLIPIMHHTAGTMLDEDVWSEIQIFKKGLTKLFEEMSSDKLFLSNGEIFLKCFKKKDVIFMEMNRSLYSKRHMVVECIPVDKEIGDLAPVYFKKAIQESDTEWAQNKKLIDTRKKDLRSSVPKGLPYFSVEFGLDGGFAHVIENEDLIPPYFGKEIVGGMLELEPFIWKKPRKENFQTQKRKVLEFADWWKPYDWSQRIKKK